MPERVRADAAVVGKQLRLTRSSSARPELGIPGLFSERLPLNEQTLLRHARRVAVPRYDRSSLRRGVVHISVGSFHRAHQAVYFDELAQCGLADGWALTGVGMHRREM